MLETYCDAVSALNEPGTREIASRWRARARRYRFFVRGLNRSRMRASSAADTRRRGIGASITLLFTRLR